MNLYKTLVAIALLMLAVLSYRLWLADDGYMEVRRLQKEIGTQEQELASKQRRNRELAAEVKDLKEGVDAVEERARSELGMTRKGETFVQITETVDAKSPPD